MIQKKEGTKDQSTEKNPEVSRSLITDYSILFSSDDLTISDAKKIRRGGRYNPNSIRKFEKKLKKTASFSLKDKNKIAERKGIGWWILNDREQARKEFTQAGTDISRSFHALTLKQDGTIDDALEYIESLPADAASGKNIMTIKAKLLFLSNRIKDGTAVIKKLVKKHPECSEVKTVQAMYAEETGDPQTALDLYQDILETDPANEEVLFYCAQLLDRFGIDHLALEYYEKAANIFPAHINSVLNLGQKYYETGENEKAAFCFKRVLKLNPGHSSASRFLNDIKATDNMYYDEKKAKRREELNKILQIPVSDFELSVRSRNCLSRMNIITLGDLIKKTESDLLSYKNFGETSLAEIKRMLASKGLYLGQAKDMQNQELKEKHKRKLIDVTDNELLEKKVEDLELSVRANKCLSKLDIETFGDIIKNSEQELLQVRNFGQTSLNEIKQKLASYGLSLKNK